MTGTTLKSFDYAPAAVLRDLGCQFKQPLPDRATLRSLHRRRPTRFAHQRWAIQQWGLRECDSAIEQRLTEHLHPRTRATLSRGQLEQAAREWFRAYVAIPRSCPITVLVRAVVQSVALQDHRGLRCSTPDHRRRFQEVLIMPDQAEVGAAILVLSTRKERANMSYQAYNNVELRGTSLLSTNDAVMERCKVDSAEVLLGQRGPRRLEGEGTCTHN